MDHIEELVAFIEKALGRMGVASVGRIDDEPGVLGVEFEDGEMVFIKVEPA